MPRYDAIGKSYATRRRPDSHIEARLLDAFGDATSVINVGAGSGSYEPRDRRVMAIEPSPVMIEQRDPTAAPVIRAVAEALPVASHSFDVALGILTVHHWSDVARGLGELQRVADRQIVLTWDPRMAADFWLVAEYVPEIAEWDRQLDPLDVVLDHLDVDTIEPLPVPADCTDGFLAAYWRRPEAYLDPGVRGAMSGLSLIDQTTVDRAMERLARDLDTGAWHDRHHDLLGFDELDVGYKLVTAHTR